MPIRGLHEHRHRGPEACELSPALPAIVLIAVVAFLALTGCSSKTDPFVGTWHGIGGQSSLTMQITREGDAVYTMTRTDDHSVSLLLVQGELAGVDDDWKVLKNGSTVALHIRIFSTGPNTLIAKVTGKTGGRTVVGDTSDWLREGAPTPAPLAAKFVPSQADLDYLADVLAGMKSVHRTISLIDEAWRKQDALHKDPARTQRATDLSYSLARNWDTRLFEPLSPQLRRLSRRWIDARARSERLVDEAYRAYLSIYKGRMPRLNSLQLLALLANGQRAYQRLEVEYKRVIGYE